MPKGIPKNGINNGWFKDGDKAPNSAFKKGNKVNLGRKHTENTKKKISKSNLGRKYLNRKSSPHSERHKKNIGKALRGNKSSFWKGGISDYPYPIDWSKTLKRSIRERDRYVCKLCSKQQEEKAFDIHHIDYNKKNCNPNNLITLCRSCHSKTNINRNYWIKLFTNLIKI